MQRTLSVSLLVFALLACLVLACNRQPSAPSSSASPETNKPGLSNNGRKSDFKIINLTYISAGKTYKAERASEQDIQKAGLALNCACGDEVCEGGFKRRCMAGGGGVCVWFLTNEVC
jgi:hypothetical protein